MVPSINTETTIYFEKESESLLLVKLRHSLSRSGDPTAHVFDGRPMPHGACTTQTLRLGLDQNCERILRTSVVRPCNGPLRNGSNWNGRNDLLWPLKSSLVWALHETPRESLIEEGWGCPFLCLGMSVQQWADACLHFLRRPSQLCSFCAGLI